MQLHANIIFGNFIWNLIGLDGIIWSELSEDIPNFQELKIFRLEISGDIHFLKEIPLMKLSGDPDSYFLIG